MTVNGKKARLYLPVCTNVKLYIMAVAKWYRLIVKLYWMNVKQLP